eukprot:g7901.t1
MNLGASYRQLSRYLQTSSGFGTRRRDHCTSPRTEPLPFETTQSPVTPSILHLYQKQTHRTRALHQQSTVVDTMAGHTIHLPIEYIQLLGLHPGDNVQESQVIDAFEVLSNKKIDDEYSARAMAGRQQLLEEAKEDALNHHINRKTSTAPRVSRGLHLLSHLVPGALLLLLEISHYDLVIKVGKKMIESTDKGTMRRDILLAMTMAKLGQAYDAFQEPTQVALASRLMEEALDLLRDGGSPSLAPDLSKEIADAFKTFVPSCVLEQLQLPLTEDSDKGRKEAVYILQGLLAVPKERDSSFIEVDRHYVKQAMSTLTSVEILNSIDWTTILTKPKLVKWYYPGLLLKGASVHIVIGFLECKPDLLKSLDSILNLPGKDREAYVEHVICKVLLGEVEKAVEILERMEGSHSKPKNPKDDDSEDKSTFSSTSSIDQSLVGAKLLPGRNETLAFVKANSGDNPDDYLSGLYTFVDRWLQHAGFSQFRDLSNRSPSMTLEDYFKDRKVENFLKSNSKAHNRLFGLIFNSSSNNNNNNDNDDKNKNKKNENNKTQSPRDPGQSETKSDHFLKDGSSMPPPPPDYENDDYETSSLISQKDFGILRNPAILGAMLGGTLLGSALFAFFRNPWIRHLSKDPPPDSNVIQEISLQVKSSTPIDQQKIKRKPQTSLSKNQQSKSTTLNKKEAEFLIRKWQYAKAKALGPDHQFRYMRKVLTSPMLELWSSNIRKVQEQGWFWKYKLDSCKVTSIDLSHLSEEDSYVKVYATLKERATMYGRSGKALDHYDSRYQVAYEIIMDEEGQWKIRDVLIIR